MLKSAPFGDQFGLALYDKDQEHVTDAAPAANNSNTNAPAANIPTVEATPPKPTISQRAMAKAPRPPVQEGPRSEVERKRRNSELAFDSLIKGDTQGRGINQLFQALVNGDPLDKLQDELRRWVARASALRPTLTEKEDAQAVENGYLTFKAELDKHQKAHKDDAAKVAAA
jgi:hypothetical protein